MMGQFEVTWVWNYTTNCDERAIVERVWDQGRLFIYIHKRLGVH